MLKRFSTLPTKIIGKVTNGKMTKEITLRHEFVDSIPSIQKEQIIYISIRFKTATHLCCCGCKNKVVTPLHPTDWKLIFDGNSVSLDPSIGNWNFECRSHYWIRNNKVIWAKKWSKKRIDAGREKDSHETNKNFDKKTKILVQRRITNWILSDRIIIISTKH